VTNNTPKDIDMSSNATTTKIWLITGAGRGMGVGFAQAALAVGHKVVASGRNPDTARTAVDAHERLLVTELDITDAQSAERAVAAAVTRFGRIDVLVNNPGNFFGGFFEELSPQQVRSQIETSLFGPMTVTRAPLPVMRKQRCGLVISISSRRRGRRRGRRGEGPASPRAGRRATRAVHQPRPRGRPRGGLTGTRTDEITNSRRPLCVEQ